MAVGRVNIASISDKFDFGARISLFNHASKPRAIIHDIDDKYVYCSDRERTDHNTVLVIYDMNWNVIKQINKTAKNLISIDRYGYCTESAGKIEVYDLNDNLLKIFNYTGSAYEIRHVFKYEGVYYIALRGNNFRISDEFENSMHHSANYQAFPVTTLLIDKNVIIGTRTASSTSNYGPISVISFEGGMQNIKSVENVEFGIDTDTTKLRYGLRLIL